MTSSPEGIGPIVVGTAIEEPASVLHEAAHFARDFGTPLVCAHVDSTRYTVEEHPDGSVSSMPLDPDVPDVRDEVFPPQLMSHIRSTLADEDLELSFRALAGDPSQALSVLAEHINARAIVIGTRHPGFRASLEEFFTGSVAVRLAHRQARPVIVVPLEPHSHAAPWENNE